MPRAAALRPTSPRKGDLTRGRLLAAANEIIATEGMAAASQENVARAAGITQSALRHHFPTKDDLLQAIVREALASFRASFEAILLAPSRSPAARLAGMIDAHFRHVAAGSAAHTFEIYAFWAREAAARRPAHEWFGWLTEHYASLIGAMQPEIDVRECRERAFLVLTLCLGSWVTLGRSRPNLVDRNAQHVQHTLQRGVDRIVGAALPWKANA